MKSVVNFCGWMIALLAACPLAGADRAGWSFDTGLSSEQAAELPATFEIRWAQVVEFGEPK